MGRTVRGRDGGLPPAEVGPAGLIEQRGTDDGGCESFGGQHTAREQALRSDAVGHEERPPHERCQLAIHGVGSSTECVQHGQCGGHLADWQIDGDGLQRESPYFRRERWSRR